MAETRCFDADKDLVGFWGRDWDVIIDCIGFVVGVDLDCFHCWGFGAVLLIERVCVGVWNLVL